MTGGAAAQADADPFAAARREFERAMLRNIKGVEYLGSPAPVVGSSGKDVLISRGTFRLYHYRPLVDEIYRMPLMLVMAPTNRGYIFDMAPGQSFVEFLLKAGYDVFMVDWDAPRPEEKTVGIADYVLDFLPSAVQRVRAVTGESDVSVVGYCAGGLLSLLWAATAGAAGPANLVTFTTPVDFRHMPQFQAWSDKSFFDVDRLVDTVGNVPSDLIMTSFEMLRPAQRVAGNIRLYDNLWDDEFVKAHRMFDRWGMDALPLPGEYFRDMTKTLMWDNALIAGTMTVAGRPVDLGAIAAPYLHITAQHDHIVPPPASAPLIEMVGSQEKNQVELKGGHVSLIAGANAVRRMWPMVDEWLGEKSV
ncbi:alpha/beta fold hydrolase [Sphingopyxis granuli]|uniref:alpha/beta fold hydrolase n=1 Tax=Sphingopyxis granuli TaxID=267128 RepID=UPI0008324879|nr:alpha/beta fold hydrolase [Sphingopyxis granuli]